MPVIKSLLSTIGVLMVILVIVVGVPIVAVLISGAGAVIAILAISGIVYGFCYYLITDTPLPKPETSEERRKRRYEEIK